MLDTERIYALIDDWTPRGTYDIRRAAVYEFHAGTAQKWRQGRIFLAGDAAHQTPPFLGQGMNTGMRDVVNLAWKLSLVCDGTCVGLGAENLLESYETERRAHATDMVEWAVSIGRLMEHLAQVEDAQRRGVAPPETPSTLKASGYGQGRGVPPIRNGFLKFDQVSIKGATGYLFSQPIIKSKSGDQVKLDEFLGAGFALVHKGSIQLNEQSQKIVQQLNITITNIEGLDVERGHFDHVFEENNCALVRPDRVIFGHTTDSLNENELLAVFHQQLFIAA